MAKPLFANELNLRPNAVVRVVVDISPDAKRFMIDLGSGGSDLAMHFNPRFDYHGFRNVIIFNTSKNGNFGKEVKEKHFPFQRGTKAEIFILFDENSFLVRLPDGFECRFPNRTGATVINYMGVRGDAKTRTLAFE